MNFPLWKETSWEMQLGHHKVVGLFWLERSVGAAPWALTSGAINQADLTVGCVWLWADLTEKKVLCCWTLSTPSCTHMHPPIPTTLVLPRVFSSPGLFGTATCPHHHEGHLPPWLSCPVNSKARPPCLVSRALTCSVLCCAQVAPQALISLFVVYLMFCASQGAACTVLS